MEKRTFVVKTVIPCEEKRVLLIRTRESISIREGRSASPFEAGNLPDRRCLQAESSCLLANHPAALDRSSQIRQPDTRIRGAGNDEAEFGWFKEMPSAPEENQCRRTVQSHEGDRFLAIRLVVLGDGHDIGLR